MTGGAHDLQGLSVTSWIRRTVASLGFLVLVAALLMLLSSSAAQANDTAVGGIGGDVYPLSSTDIRMYAETVQAVLYGGFAEYRVDFTFLNRGGSQKVTLGFPFIVTRSGGNGNAPVAFRAWQDGKPLPVSVGQEVTGDDLMGNPPLGYYLHEATFPPGKTVITVSYLAEPTVSAGGRLDDLTPEEARALGISGWSAHYDYWLHTGAGWEGTIGTAVVRFMLADSFNGWAVDVKATDREALGGAPLTSPESYVKLDDRTYEWIFENFEPTEDNDILLAFTRPNLLHMGHPTLPTSYGAFATTEGASERLGPNPEAWMPAGYEAIDGSPETAWGFSDPGNGWIQLGISGSQDLKEIRILPGRNDAPGSFYAYGRPKSLDVVLADGTQTTVSLKDEPAVQRFAFSGTSDWVEVHVTDIYPGTESNDTYISEIEFGTEPAPSFEEISTLTIGQSPSTSQVPSTTSSSTVSIPSATTQASAAVTTTGSPPTTVAETADVDRRLVWPAYLAIAVAVIAVAAAAFLFMKLRGATREA